MGGAVPPVLLYVFMVFMVKALGQLYLYLHLTSGLLSARIDSKTMNPLEGMPYEFLD
jgi:hypothetical protein